MPRRRELLTTLVLGFAAIAGCSKPAEQPKVAARVAANVTDPTSSIATTSGCINPPGNTDGPEGAVCRFLDAMRAGDDEKTEALFVTLARQRIKEEKISVTPRGSDTVRFEIGKVEHIGDDGARVACRCSDMDAEGQKQTDEMTVMVRKEADGWRIAGMALTVFDGEAPVLLDFEQPKEVQQKLALVRQEVARRLAAEAEQAQRPDDSAPTVQR